LDDQDCINVMQRVLSITDGELDPALLNQYDCSDIDPVFDGLLLARRGVLKTTHGAQVIICNECHQCLTSGYPGPPKYAIANGFFIGVLPQDLQDATWIETVMT
jgi:hypothetical protein